MKILHIIPSISSASGGPPRSTRSTIKAISEYKETVTNTILTTDEALEAEWLKDYSLSLGENCQVKVCSQIGKHTLNISPELFRWLYKNAREYDLIIVRAMLHPISTVSCFIARLKGVPYVITPHGTLSEHTFSHKNTLFKKIYFKLFESRSVKNAEYIQATSKFEKEQIEGLGTKCTVEVIPHPFQDGQAYNRENCKRGSILFMSRIDPMKGFDLLIPAIDQLKKDAHDFVLKIAGSGEDSYESSIKEKVKNLDLASSVKFLGFIEGEEKKRALEEAGMFVLPSYRENYGIAVVEAMNAGLPVIITREVDIYPEVEKYNAGLVIDNNVSELKKAIVELLENPDLASEMGQNGKKLVSAEYGPEAIGKKIFNLYKKASTG